MCGSTTPRCRNGRTTRACRWKPASSPAARRYAMPTFRPSPDLDMHYEVDDFTDPWRKPETILLLHGNAESGLAWWAWVPHLARHYRVVRPDEHTSELQSHSDLVCRLLLE